MNTNRRNFFKLGGLATLSLAGANILSSAASAAENNNLSSDPKRKQGKQKFNMCGYAAPKMDVVRVGFIGLGHRGPTHLNAISLLDGVDIKALCDVVPEKIEKAKNRIAKSGFKPEIYTGDPNAWKKLCEREDLDLIVIATQWDMHTPMAVYAMEQGKHVCI